MSPLHAIGNDSGPTSPAKHFPTRKIALGPSDTILDRRNDGAILLRSPHALGPHPAKPGERYARAIAAALPLESMSLQRTLSWILKQASRCIMTPFATRHAWRG
jgi:hypothetical protein